jgi:hypothetical protein
MPDQKKTCFMLFSSRLIPDLPLDSLRIASNYWYGDATPSHMRYVGRQFPSREDDIRSDSLSAIDRRLTGPVAPRARTGGGANDH